jgi:hypothetical protein
VARTGKATNGPVIVTGPGEDGRRLPHFGAALAYTMHRAGMTDDTRTWYVRDETTGTVSLVERDANGCVTATTRKGTP